VLTGCYPRHVPVFSGSSGTLRMVPDSAGGKKI
jgi:hypothetical protein